MAKARKRVRPDTSLERLFVASDAEKRETPESKVYAVRQLRGPEEHRSLIIRAWDPTDAIRQFFNHYGLQEQTHRYRCQCVQVPDDDQIVSNAIQCDIPRHPGLTLEERFSQNYEEVERAIRSGEAMAEVESM